jgi:hypothetical protein
MMEENSHMDVVAGADSFRVRLMRNYSRGDVRLPDYRRQPRYGIRAMLRAESTVASLHVKAAKSCLSVQFVQIVQIGESITYPESED